MRLKLNDYSQSELIRILREWSGLTQKEFGKAIDKSEKTIRDYESGRRNYDIRTIMKIMNKFGITITFEKNKK